jgi:hypothetical protein
MVTVMDQVSRLVVSRCGFDQLPPDPSGGRMGGDFDVDELATPMTNEEDDVERLEGQGLDDEEVGGPERPSMVGKEDAPAPARRSRMARSAVGADRARTDHDAELEELAADAFGARSGFSLAMWRSVLGSQGSIVAGPAGGLSACASKAASVAIVFLVLVNLLFGLDQRRRLLAQIKRATEAQEVSST